MQTPIQTERNVNPPDYSSSPTVACCFDSVPALCVFWSRPLMKVHPAAPKTSTASTSSVVAGQPMPLSAPPLSCPGRAHPLRSTRIPGAVPPQMSRKLETPSWSSSACNALHPRPSTTMPSGVRAQASTASFTPSWSSSSSSSASEHPSPSASRARLNRPTMPRGHPSAGSTRPSSSSSVSSSSAHPSPS